MTDNERVVAALDCGTNSTRLLVADGSGRALAREMRITRLGEGVDESRLLQPEAVERTLSALREFRAIMEREETGQARLVATSAVRDAANGDNFLRAASDVTGVAAELLSGQEEGVLSYAGATAELSGGDGPVVVVDIGGGSTEIATATGGDVHVVSLAIGCVRLTERFLIGDPPTDEELAAAVAAIGAALDAAEEAVPALAERRAGARLVGLAGTVSTLASLDAGLTEYDRDRIHHAVLSAAAVAHWCETLGRERVAERARRVGIPAGREDVIVGGALVLREVMRRFGFDRCIVSEADILDGLVLTMAHP